MELSAVYVTLSADIAAARHRAEIAKNKRFIVFKGLLISHLVGKITTFLRHMQHFYGFLAPKSIWNDKNRTFCIKSTSVFCEIELTNSRKLSHLTDKLQGEVCSLQKFIIFICTFGIYAVLLRRISPKEWFTTHISGPKPRERERSFDEPKLKVLVCLFKRKVQQL